jgi:hypothetical protein
MVDMSSNTENIGEYEVLKSQVGMNVGMYYVGRMYFHEGVYLPYSVDSAFFITRNAAEDYFNTHFKK